VAPLRIRYERLVADPGAVVAEIASLLNKEHALNIRNLQPMNRPMANEKSEMYYARLIDDFSQLYQRFRDGIFNSAI
jgi:LPS sulfotransferase NodH